MLTGGGEAPPHTVSRAKQFCWSMEFSPAPNWPYTQSGYARNNTNTAHSIQVRSTPAIFLSHLPGQRSDPRSRNQENAQVGHCPNVPSGRGRYNNILPVHEGRRRTDAHGKKVS